MSIVPFRGYARYGVISSCRQIVDDWNWSVR